MLRWSILGLLASCCEDARLTSETSIIVDAAVRRFQCQRAYLRAHAGLRWMNTRNSVLRGQKPNASHLSALQAADSTLRMVRHFSLAYQITLEFTTPYPLCLLLVVEDEGWRFLGRVLMDRP